jgi:chaperone required for assembly of F1-ATPase
LRWQLDGRPVKTPLKRALVMPGEAMARAVAEEWEAQETHIDPMAP